MSEPCLRALVFSGDERIREAFESVGPLVAAGESVLAHLEAGEQDLVVLDAFSDPDAIGYLRGMTGEARRALTVVLVSESVCTGDPMQAWRESVDLVVHTEDLDSRLPALIEGVRAERVRFLEPLRGAIASTGGA